MLFVHTEVIKVVHVLLAGVVVSLQGGGGRQGHVLQRLPQEGDLAVGHPLHRLRGAAWYQRNTDTLVCFNGFTMWVKYMKGTDVTTQKDHPGECIQHMRLRARLY